MATSLNYLKGEIRKTNVQRKTLSMVINHVNYMLCPGSDGHVPQRRKGSVKVRESLYFNTLLFLTKGL